MSNVFLCVTDAYSFHGDDHETHKTHQKTTDQPTGERSGFGVLSPNGFLLFHRMHAGLAVRNGLRNSRYGLFNSDRKQRFHRKRFSGCFRKLRLLRLIVFPAFHDLSRISAGASGLCAERLSDRNAVSDISAKRTAAAISAGRDLALPAGAVCLARIAAAGRVVYASFVSASLPIPRRACYRRR